MGYINDHTTRGPPYSCHDLYQWILEVNPAFQSDDDVIKLVGSEEADIELWQFMGRRFLPPPPPVLSPRTQPEGAEYYPFKEASRGFVRPYQVRIQFSFADQLLRDRVAGRLTAEGLKVTRTWREPIL